MNNVIDIQIPDYYIDNPVSINELKEWEKDKLINPRTKRKLKPNSIIIKYLESEYSKIKNNESFIQKQHNQKIIQKEIQVKAEPIQQNDKLYKIEDSIDDKDPISLSYFWKQNGDKKEIVHENPNSLILYKDGNGFIRCFEKESLEYMKSYNITKHPITQETIPNEVFLLVNKKDIIKEKTIEDYALGVFNKFNELSIFIDSELFVNLNKQNLLKLSYEMKDLYQQNFSNSQKLEFSQEPLFNKSPQQLHNMDTKDIQRYLLQNMEIILNIKNNNIKNMAFYILVGALSIVIPKIKEIYPDIAFLF